MAPEWLIVWRPPWVEGYFFQVVIAYHPRTMDMSETRLPRDIMWVASQWALWASPACGEGTLTQWVIMRRFLSSVDDAIFHTRGLPVALFLGHEDEEAAITRVRVIAGQPGKNVSPLWSSPYPLFTPHDT